MLSAGSVGRVGVMLLVLGVAESQVPPKAADAVVFEVNVAAGKARKGAMDWLKKEKFIVGKNGGPSYITAERVWDPAAEMRAAGLNATGPTFLDTVELWIESASKDKTSLALSATRVSKASSGTGMQLGVGPNTKLQDELRAGLEKALHK